MFYQKCPQNCLLMLSAVYVVKNRGGYIMCVCGGGGSHPSFGQINIKKYHKSSKIAQNVIKAKYFAQSCTMVY